MHTSRIAGRFEYPDCYCRYFTYKHLPDHLGYYSIVIIIYLSEVIFIFYISTYKAPDRVKRPQDPTLLYMSSYCEFLDGIMGWQ